jgi:tol-pal system protein YbgF
VKGASAAVLLLPLVLTACATRGSVTRARAEIAALGEEIEAVRRAQDKIARELSAVVAQLRGTEERAAAIGPRVDEQAEAARKLAERVDGVEANLARARPVAESAARETPRAMMPAMAAVPERVRPPEPGARPDAPEQKYAAALEVFQAREYGQAVLDFLDFIARYPKHQLASNAQYWIAEAYYVQRDYRQATLEFQKVLDADARGVKAPEALLKIGLCYVSLHQPTRAQELWQQVVRDYPDSEAARKARTLIHARGVSPRRSR